MMRYFGAVNPTTRAQLINIRLEPPQNSTNCASAQYFHLIKKGPAVGCRFRDRGVQTR